jgi:hypothetical protein
MEPSSLKILLPIECQHCKKQNIVSMEMAAPTPHNVYKDEDLKEAKEECILKLQDIPGAEEVVSWLLNDTTIVTPDEVDNIVLNALSQKS